MDYYEFQRACRMLASYRANHDDVSADRLANCLDTVLLAAVSSDPELADVYDREVGEREND